MGVSSVSFFAGSGALSFRLLNLKARERSMSRVISEIAIGVRYDLTSQNRLCGSAAMADASYFFL